MPLVKTTVSAIQKFLWKNIIYRFGLPQQIITDRGPQFSTPLLGSWCDDLDIKLTFASVTHPPCNGQVEAANKSILNGLKKTIIGAQGKCVEVLPQVLWANQTTLKNSNRGVPIQPHLRGGGNCPYRELVP